MSQSGSCTIYDCMRPALWIHWFINLWRTWTEYRDHELLGIREHGEGGSLKNLKRHQNFLLQATHISFEWFSIQKQVDSCLFTKYKWATYLSNLWTHFTLVFPSWRSIWWMRMNMATVTCGALCVALTAFGSVNGLRHYEAGLTGATRGRRRGRGWRVTSMTV